MPVYNVLNKENVYIAVDLLSNTAFEELDGLVKQGFLLLKDNVEAVNSEEAIKAVKIDEGLSYEYAENVYTSTSTILPKGKEIQEVFGIVSTTERSGYGLKKQLTEDLLGKFSLRLLANAKEIEALKMSVINNMKLQCVDLGGNAVMGISIQVQELANSESPLFLVSGTGTACAISDA